MVNMTKKQRDLFKLLKQLETFSQKGEKLFNGHYFLDDEIDTLWGIIADEYDIDARLFTETDIADVLFEFGLGKITITQAHKQLKEISKEQNN